MADNQSRLTVLTGPMAGKELVLDEAVDNVLIGSDEACRFHLPVPGVEPIHARLWMDASGVTVYETGSPRGLFVNDDRVNGQAPIRNGDILWLGTPGENDVVMIQCRLPARTPATVAPPAAPAAQVATEPESIPSPDSDAEETMLIVGRGEKPSHPSEEPELAHEPTAFDASSHEEPALSSGPERTFDAAEEPSAAADEDFVIRESEPSGNAPEPQHEAEPTVIQPFIPPSITASEPSPFSMSGEAPHPAFEDETEATLVMQEPSEEGPTVRVARPPLSAPEPPHVEELPTLITPPAPPPPSPPPPPAPPPVVARPRPAQTPHAPAPRPQPPASREAKQPPASRPQRKGGGSSAGLYVGIAIVLLLVLGGGGFLALRYLRPGGTPVTPAPSVAPPTTMAAVPPPSETTTPPETVAPAPPTTAPVEEKVPVAKPTPAPAAPSAAPSKGPTPSPSPAAKPKPVTPATTQPAAPSAEALRAQQVDGLLTQADAAGAAHNYDQAAGLYDQVLKLDPQNSRAVSGKGAAQAILASLKRSFIPGKTVVRSGKAAKGGPAGFDSEDVNLAKAPDYSGRIDFEVVPAHVKPGDSYTLRVFLTNDGKKAFKIGSMSIVTSTNGTKAGGPVSPAVKEVQPQQRVPLQESSGTWGDGTTSWNTDVDIASDHGDTFKNQVSWR